MWSQQRNVSMELIWSDLYWESSKTKIGEEKDCIWKTETSIRKLSQWFRDYKNFVLCRTVGRESLNCKECRIT
jgi:hypothetical protein